MAGIGSLTEIYQLSSSRLPKGARNFQTSKSHSVAPDQQHQIPPRNLLEIQILWPHLRSTELETGGGANDQHFNQLFTWNCDSYQSLRITILGQKFPAFAVH